MITFWFVQVPMRLCLENFHQISTPSFLIELTLISLYILVISVLFEHYLIFSRFCNISATGSFFWAGELMPCYQHFSRQKYTKISHVLGGYIYPISRGLRWSLQGLRWLHDDRRQSYIVLISLTLSHDHRTMVAANRTISRGRSQIVADYHTMVVRWSCNNRRLAYDLDSKMLRSLKTCRKAIVVCDCSYDCGKNHCDCPRSLPVVDGRRS